MCGIAGYVKCEFSKEMVDKDVLTLMRDSLIHRGPDGFGNYISEDGRVGFSHRRLAILDLSEAGVQPMCDDDGALCITYNGEIYNYKEIREELKSKGYRFKSQTDTEVILYCYKEYGEKCLDMFNGMFSFAILDRDKNKVFLARDRFGIKPLYYGMLDNETFVFGSELKALVLHPSFKKKIDFEALGCFFRYRFIPAPYSIWKSIRKLTHGHYLSFDLSEFKMPDQVKYYDFAKRVATREPATVNEVEQLLCDSVKRRLLTSDVEVGVFLSGGVDSTVISYISKRYHNNVKAFSTGFDVESHDESIFAKGVAKHLGVNHILNIVNKDTEINTIDKISWIYDEPMADTSNIPTYILSKNAANYVKVVLSGDGGDEVFSGYNWFKHYEKVVGCNFIQRLYRRYIRKEKFDQAYQKLLYNAVAPKHYKKLFSRKILKKMRFGKNLFYSKYNTGQFKHARLLQYIDLNLFMIEDCLTKVDRASMANSLEVRVPMLDHNLVEAVYSLDEEVFSEKECNKSILRSFIRDKKLKKYINPNKKGFSAPCHEWEFFKDGALREYFENGEMVNSGIVKKSFLSNINSVQVFMLYVLEAWFKVWNGHEK